MAAPTTAARVNKALANPEPSTHGPTQPAWVLQQVGCSSQSTGRRLKSRGVTISFSLATWASRRGAIERSLIRERVMAGLARARKHGTKSGRPCGRPKIDPATEVLIREALAKGDKGLHKIAAAHRVGTGTVQRIKAELATAE